MLYIKNSVWLILFSFLTGIFLLGSGRMAHASLKCEVVNTPHLLIIGKDLALKISSSTPYGTILHNNDYKIRALCSRVDLGSGEMLYFHKMNLDGALGNDLKMVVTFNGDADEGEKHISTGVVIHNKKAFWGFPSSYWQLVELDVNIKIVKNKNISPDHKPPADYVNIFRLDSIPSRGYYAPYYINGIRSIVYTMETCLVLGPHSFSVSLGKINLDSTSGLGAALGSSSKAKEFSIRLFCDPELSGAFKVVMRLEGNTLSGYTEQGVLSLHDSPNTASGVGIQILHGESRLPVAFSTPWEITRFPLSLPYIHVPFLVRFYQTEPHITPGIAASSMTYFIEYL